jgi:ankyrin repeat protein
MLCTTEKVVPRPEPVMRALLAHDTGLINIPDVRGLTALVAFAQNRRHETAKFLLSAGANPSSSDSWGMTILMLRFCNYPASGLSCSTDISEYIRCILNAVYECPVPGVADVTHDGSGTKEQEEQPRKRQRM